MTQESPMMKHVEGDGVLFVKFKWDGVKNERSSEEHARPIYDKVLRVFITAPGNKNQVTTHEVERHFWVPEGDEPRVRTNDAVKARFREQLNAWENNNAEELAGTPLNELPGMDAAEVATCKEMGVHTVEALAGISDTNLFMGARKWRTLAQAFMDKAEGNAPMSKLAAENEALKVQLQDLSERLDRAEAGDGGSAGNKPNKANKPKAKEAA